MKKIYLTLIAFSLINISNAQSWMQQDIQTLNKINTILELVNGHTDNLELIGEQLEELSNILLEVYVDNSNSSELGQSRHGINRRRYGM